MTKEDITYRNVVAGISVFMLLLAIPKLPYGYYILLRWTVTATALFSVWVASEYECKLWVFVMGGIAVLFNPIIQIHVSKEAWIVIDSIVATIFLISIFKIKPKKESRKKEGIQDSERLVKKTFMKRWKKETARNLSERDKEKLQEERRKRDNAFVKSWDRGASNEELAKEFGLEAEGVKKLRTTLLLNRLELRRKKKRERLIIILFFAFIIVLGIIVYLTKPDKQQGDLLEEWLERTQQEGEREPELGEYDKLILEKNDLE